MDSTDRHDPLYHRRLSNVADVNSRLEPGVDCCRVEQHAHCRLSTHRGQFKYIGREKQTPILVMNLMGERS